MHTNFELKQLKPKLDIVKKPENRVHELTDSNVSLVQLVAPKDLALRRSDQRLAPISAYRRPFPPILKVASLSTVGAQNW